MRTFFSGLSVYSGDGASILQHHLTWLFAQLHHSLQMVLHTWITPKPQTSCSRPAVFSADREHILNVINYQPSRYKFSMFSTCKKLDRWRTKICFQIYFLEHSSEVSGIYRSLFSDWPRSLLSAGHRSWRIRRPAAQSKLRELRQRARSACFVPVMLKIQNNRDFTLSLTIPDLCRWCRKWKIQPGFPVQTTK